MILIKQSASDIIQILVIEKLRERYPKIHPVMFFRSMEKAISPGDLFDILDTFPSGFPIEWNFSARKWEKTNSLISKKR